MADGHHVGDDHREGEQRKRDAAAPEEEPLVHASLAPTDNRQE
jgi:hypothetical protein